MIFAAMIATIVGTMISLRRPSRREAQIHDLEKLPTLVLLIFIVRLRVMAEINLRSR
jgi:hypothetical protein